MNTTCITSEPGAASSCPPSVIVWQRLLTRLLAQHYGLTLTDTPFCEPHVIEFHIAAGITVADAMNFFVQQYDLVRTDQSCCGLHDMPPFITATDLLHARIACGLSCQPS